MPKFYPNIRSPVGFEKIVQMLIAKGANVNATNDDHFSALIPAVANGNEFKLEFIQSIT